MSTDRVRHIVRMQILSGRPVMPFDVDTWKSKGCSMEECQHVFNELYAYVGKVGQRLVKYAGTRDFSEYFWNKAGISIIDTKKQIPAKENLPVKQIDHILKKLVDEQKSFNLTWLSGRYHHPLRAQPNHTQEESLKSLIWPKHCFPNFDKRRKLYPIPESRIIDASIVNAYNVYNDLIPIPGMQVVMYNCLKSRYELVKIQKVEHKLDASDNPYYNISVCFQNGDSDIHGICEIRGMVVDGMLEL